MLLNDPLQIISPADIGKEIDDRGLDWALSNKALANALTAITEGRLRSLIFCEDDIRRARLFRVEQAEYDGTR